MRTKNFAFDKNLSNEKRLDKLEAIVTRLSRRIRKTVTGIVSPQTISSCVVGEDVKGVIMNYMFFSGEVSKAIICFNKKPKNPINVEIKLLDKSIGIAKNYYIERIRESVVIDTKTQDGTMLTVSVHPTNEEDKINEIWFALLWVPSIQSAVKENYLIDTLERESNDNLSG